MAELPPRRVVALAAVTGALVGGMVAGAVAVASASGTNGGTASSPAGGGAVVTAPVVRTDLSSTVQDGGSIGYAGSYTVGNEPVPLLYGSIPAWRAFQAGMTAGADVGELTRDLIALGYGDGLAQGDAYSTATVAAVDRWQAARGLPVTGKIPLGGVVFEPGPIRVASVMPTAGTPAGGAGSAVLSATSTTPVVTVDLDVSQEYLVSPGDAVQVVLPDGTTTVGGHIQTVGNVATCPGGGGAGSGASSAGQSPCSSAGSGTNASPTVAVTITLDSTPSLATLDQAPVNVNITTQRVSNVLAVPVNALLALADGGFGVDVVTGRSSHLVGVSTGLYSNNLVQVSGSGIAAGMQVEVPSS